MSFPSRRAAALLAFAVLALLAVHAAVSGCDHDEVQHLHGAWLISQGDAPFRDFIEQRSPTLHHALAPVARAFEGSPRALVFATRLLNLAVIAGVLAAFLALARSVLRNPEDRWPLLVLAGCFFFLRNSLEVRPDPWMSALCVLSLWQWSIYLREGGLRRAAIAGLLLGAGIAVLQKAVAFGAFLGLGTLLVAFGRAELRKRIAAGGALFTVCMLVPVAVLLGLIQRAGLWSDFYFWNQTFNRVYYFQTSFDGPSALATFAVSIGEDPLLWLAGLAGLAMVARNFRRAVQQPELVLCSTIVVGIAAGVASSRWPFGHNLLLLQPALALLAVHALDAIEQQRLRSIAAAAMVLLIAKVAVLCAVYDEGHGNYAVQRQVLAETKVTDRVAVPPPYHPIFRRDAFFFWYAPVTNAIAFADCCKRYGCPPGVIERDQRAWAERPPAVVYVPPDEPTWAPYGLDAHRAEYEPSSGAGFLRRRAKP